MIRRTTIFGLALVLVLWGNPGGSACAASFTRDVAPILLAKCVACHGPQKSEGDYRLDTFDFLMGPGSSEEPGIVAGQPDASLVYDLIMAQDEDDRMPQKDDPLALDKQTLIKEWIQEGAVFDGPSQKAPLAAYAGPSDHSAPPEVYAEPIPILSLAFSADGDELAVGGYHEVTMWNPMEGRLLRRLTNIAERVYALAWAPHHSWLAVAGGTPGRGGDIRVIDPNSGALVKLLGRTVDSVLSVQFSPDESRLVAGGADNAVRLFNTTNWTEDLVVEQHADWVMDVRFDATGKRLVTASRDKSARVFDAVTGELVETFFGHKEPVFAALFDDNEERVWSAGRDRKIRLWEVNGAKQKADMGGFDDEVVRLIRVGDQLISAAGRYLFQHESGGKHSLVRRWEGHADRVYALAISETEGQIASGDHAGKVRLWNFQNGELIHEFLAVPPSH